MKTIKIALIALVLTTLPALAEQRQQRSVLPQQFLGAWCDVSSDKKEIDVVARTGFFQGWDGEHLSIYRRGRCGFEQAVRVRPNGYDAYGYTCSTADIQQVGTLRYEVNFLCVESVEPYERVHRAMMLHNGRLLMTDFTPGEGSKQ